MPKIRHHQTKRTKRTIRVRKHLHGTPERPRLTVFRSQQHIFLQVINDETQKVLASASDMGKKAGLTGTKTERATQAAELLAKKLEKAKVKKLVFDRGPYKYHGRVKAVATALRKVGMEV